MPSNLIEIVTTLATDSEAESVARAAVEAGLAACAHLEPTRAVYRWKGRTEQEGEVRLTLKTTRGRAADLERFLRERHPYETPMILQREVLQANEEYLAWVRECTESEGSS